MTCPFCGQRLPTLTGATVPRLRPSIRRTLAAHSRPHAHLTADPGPSPDALTGGRWVLDPVRRVQVWKVEE